jgi:hypothetical protein
VANIRKLNGFFTSVKQEYIQFFFNLLDLHAQSGLRHKTFFGSQRKVFVFGYR